MNRSGSQRRLLPPARRARAFQRQAGPARRAVESARDGADGGAGKKEGGRGDAVGDSISEDLAQ
ncbi:MAG: hypothetical protein OXK17_02550 [Thaumarchaeota archaeon]|nr:hypothetical protein [Nitrososphaerota archaeon]